jgi:hypothetical protein
MENILIAGANGTIKKSSLYYTFSKNFNPIAMVRKAEQQIFFTKQSIKLY